MTQHAHRARQALVGAVVVASSLAIPASQATARPVHAAASATRVGKPRVTRINRSGAAGLRTSAATPVGAAPVNASAVNASGVYEAVPHLVSYGGPLVQHPKVVQVNWGAETSLNVYGPEVKGTTTPNLQTFYTQVLNSSYMDWLDEYNANSHGIYRGTFVGKYTITPDASNNQSTIDDANIQNELVAQIGTNLPAVDDDTIYMLYFPSNKVITTDGVDSVNYFCAYHSALWLNANTLTPTRIRYAVIPDTAGRNPECGQSNAWRNITSASSHELIETITDPDSVMANSWGPPIGWYDRNYIPNTNPPEQWGEISDICNQYQSRIVGTDNVAYTVQRQWSNRSARCVTGKTISIGNGSILEGDALQRGVRIPVTLSDPATTDVTVNFSIAALTATGPAAQASGIDFGAPASSGTITFHAVNGQTPVRQTVLLMVYGDTTLESAETFKVTLSSPSVGYGLGRSVGTATILNDDPLPVNKTATVGVGDSSVSIGSYGVRQLAFPITLSAPAATDTVIAWALHNGTAVYGPEYLGVLDPVTNKRTVSGAAVIPAGKTGLILYVDVRASANASVTKTMTMSLSNLAGTVYALPSAFALTRATGTGTIFVG